MPYTLPPLPYAYDALEPHFDSRTMEIHHTKHHQAYITNVNNALGEAGVAEMPVEQLIADIGSLPQAVQGVVRNKSVYIALGVTVHRADA